jgi:phage shock protein A
MRTPYTPGLMTVSTSSLWADTPFHHHVKMADIVRHSPMNGMDIEHLANEMAKRWNCHNDLLKAIDTLIQKSDNLHAAIEGATDQFESEVAELSAATTAAEAIVKIARGQQ